MHGAVMHSLQMHNILFYIVFCKHVKFVTFLISEMFNNVKAYYADYPNTVKTIDMLGVLLAEGRICHKDLVVIFFFFLSVDSKMRHWLLCVHQPDGDRCLRDAALKKYIQLVPGGASNLSHQYNNPFMGQLVSFAPLHPHSAVPILLEISQESFFEKMFIFGTRKVLDEIFDNIKHLVLVC